MARGTRAEVRNTRPAMRIIFYAIVGTPREPEDFANLTPLVNISVEFQLFIVGESNVVHLRIHRGMADKRVQNSLQADLFNRATIGKKHIDTRINRRAFAGCQRFDNQSLTLLGFKTVKINVHSVDTLGRLDATVCSPRYRQSVRRPTVVIGFLLNEFRRSQPGAHQK